MSNQKSVRRDESWVDEAMHLITEYALESGRYLTTGKRDDVDPFVNARRAVFEHLTAPDPRDAVVELARDALIFIAELNRGGSLYEASRECGFMGADGLEACIREALLALDGGQS